MYRNTGMSPSYTNSFQSQGYQARVNSMSKTGTQFNQSRSPLYPIGPSLTQQEFKPILRAPSPSPYVGSKQSIKPPSYQQRYFRTDTGFMPAQRGGMERTFNYEQRERKLIERNELQIKQEQKRRENLNQSYERQIQNMTRLLHKNLDRKQKLLLQIQVLEKTNQEYSQKLSSLVPPKRNVELFEPLDRKQQDIIITKNKLLTDIREKQEHFLKEEEQQEQYWENQLKQKEKVLFRAQEQLKNKRIQLMNTRMTVEKPDFIQIQDQVRQQKYQDFLYQARVIEQKIQNLIKQRQQQQRQVDECLKTKRANIHTLLLKHEEKSRQSATSMMRTQQLQRVSKEMQQANENLMRQLERKQKMIEKYELDIYSLKKRKDEQEQTLNTMMRSAREDEQKEEMERGIQNQIVKIQEEIRTESSVNNKLKTQYQKLYEILCSTISRNVLETFNQTLMA